MDPFAIEGPAAISYSGGRTSAYMLRRILDAHGGHLPGNVHVLFADTGMERQETYAFVRECAARWGVEIHWVFRPSRDGESGPTPFDWLLSKRDYLPGGGLRFCTTELKIRPMKYWMLERGYEHWTNIVGFRADEERRVARSRGRKSRERWTIDFPLYDAGITVEEVNAFWRAQDFDLQLKSYEGNCTLCHLKSDAKLLQLARERPELFAWWVAQEERTGKQFRIGKRSYAQILAAAQQPPVEDLGDEVPCEETCTD